MRETISTDAAPKAIGPYSQAVVVGEWVFVSGQLGLSPCDGLLATTFAGQARQALENVVAILTAAGCGPSDVVRSTVYLTDLGSFALFNEIYREFFPPPWPAREVVQVARLPRDAAVEISAIARRPAVPVG